MTFSKFKYLEVSSSGIKKKSVRHGHFGRAIIETMAPIRKGG